MLPITARYEPWTPPPRHPDLRQSFVDPWDTYPLDNLSTDDSCPTLLDNAVHVSNGLDYTHATTNPCQNKPALVFKDSQQNNVVNHNVYLPPVSKPISYPYKDYNLNESTSNFSVQEPVQAPCEPLTHVVFNSNSSHFNGSENTLLHAAFNHSNSTVVVENVVHFQDLEVKHVPTQNNQHEIRQFQCEPNENYQEVNVEMHAKHSDHDSQSTTESPIRPSIHVYHSDPHLEASSYQQKTDKMKDGGDQSILVSSEKSDYVSKLLIPAPFICHTLCSGVYRDYEPEIMALTTLWFYACIPLNINVNKCQYLLVKKFTLARLGKIFYICVVRCF